MQIPSTEKIIHTICVLSVIAVVVIAFSKIRPKYLCISGLERNRQRILGDIEQKNREIAQLRDNQRRFREDPDFVESIARQNRRVFPGEVVFVFESEDSQK